MPWVRLDEEFVRHPKVASAGPLAIALQVAALCYCNQNLTDGFVPRSVARTLLDWEVVAPDGTVYTIALTSGMAGEDVDSEWVIGVLLEAGMWERSGRGYQIHDYFDFQPSKAQVVADREQKRAAGHKGGLASAKAKQASAQASAQAPATPLAQSEAEQPLKQNASESSSRIQAESKPDPVPVEEPLLHPSEARDQSEPKSNGRHESEGDGWMDESARISGSDFPEAAKR